MKCANCNAQIKDGSVYCPVCGKEAQMVSGYSSLEDDFLHSLLREEQTQKEKTEEIPKKKNKINQHTPILITVLVLAFLILIGISAKFVMNYKNNHSYDYQMKMAEEELVDHNYQSAITYLSKALALLPTDTNSRIKLADIYIMQEEYENAIVLLMETVKINPAEEGAYKRLIEIYLNKSQYSKIRELYGFVEDDNLKKLFKDYLVNEPVIYPSSDKYNTLISVSLISIQDEPIYYTTDGSNPMENGMLYTGSIELSKSGFYTIKAVCKNIKNNIYSDITVGEYQIEIFPPEMPSADIETDSVLTEITYVTLTTPSECRIYYTWDGSTPTTESELYVEPIEIPEGDNVLAAIAVDEKTKLSSSVFYARYIYNE